jgi:hypothetical protein
MVINSPNAVLFDTPRLIASILDAANSNCGPTINVSWTAVSGAVYQLERRVNGGAWAVGIYIGTGLSFSETGSPGLYEYRVKVIKGSRSNYSNIDGVTVIAQNTQVNTYCVGYDLWQTFTSGCGVNTRLLQALSPTCGVVYGCMDSTASNYNPNATHSNGSCVYPCEVINPTVAYTANIVGDAGCGVTVTLVGNPNVIGGTPGQFIADTVTPWHFERGSIFPAGGTVTRSGAYTYQINYYNARHNIIDVTITGFTIGGCA